MHCDWVFPYFNFFKTRSLPFFQLRCISRYESNLAGMLLLLLSRFSCVRLYATPQTAAHQAPPSLGFSRQEHWSGLPFPSPMQESEKWKWSRSVVSNSSRPHGLQPTRLLRPWDFPGKSTGVGCHCLLHYLWIELLLVAVFPLMFLVCDDLDSFQDCSGVWRKCPIGDLGFFSWLDWDYVTLLFNQDWNDGQQVPLGVPQKIWTQQLSICLRQSGCR